MIAKMHNYEAFGSRHSESPRQLSTTKSSLEHPAHCTQAWAGFPKDRVPVGSPCTLLEAPAPCPHMSYTVENLHQNLQEGFILAKVRPRCLRFFANARPAYCV